MVRTNGTKQNMLQALSLATARAQLAARLGTQSYSGDRDLYEALGYPKTLTYEDYLSRYIRQDIAKAVIDRPVNATWQGGVTLIENKEKEDTEFEKTWKELELQLKMSSYLSRADKLAGLGRYAVILLGTDDITTVEDFSKAISKKKHTLVYIKAFGEGSAKVVAWDNDTKSKRYGLPYYYNVQIYHSEINSVSTVKVHYSRVIHIVEDPLESDIEGNPRMEAIFNRLMDIEKIVGGDGEMFWRGARPGYQGKIDKDYQMTTSMQDDLKDQVSEFEHNLRRIFVNEGLDLVPLAPQVSDPTSHLTAQLKMVSAVTGIPLRILTGSERGELASSQDTEEWKTYVQGRRDGYAAPQIVRPVVDKLVELQILPKPVTGQYSIKWSDIFAISEKQRVEIGASRAGAIRDYIQNPIAETIIPPKAFMEFFLGLTDEQIELINIMVDEGLSQEKLLEEILKAELTPKQPKTEV